ncbi:hypothetical protein DSL92_06155 [Billgrantia gudaonensis]|uniref:Uncharacterized protein n=1 Tax=Billgrantia gudaonensis TaxID=376427 RepID=A0A432JIQ4_9GAMM|nr:hypothetical protein DSL92_06155 [Halomonas gudaonensis]
MDFDAEEPQRQLHPPLFESSRTWCGRWKSPGRARRNRYFVYPAGVPVQVDRTMPIRLMHYVACFYDPPA